jgi:diguanylate cyclase (GGDEF)-like protein
MEHDRMTERPRILAIDDTPANLITLGAALAKEFDLQVATSGEQGLSLALSSPPDLILLDVMMPDSDGFAVCARFKSHPQLKTVPVIFVTALSDYASEFRGLALGAADYITKPINVEIARQRIRNLLEREALRKVIEAQRNQLQIEIAAREQAEERLKHLAHYDPLTKLPNRLLLLDRLQLAMAQAERRNQAIAIAYIDLDGFKAVNDNYGHEIGDQLLITSAMRMKQSLREMDTLARMGGDEFVAILVDATDSASAESMLTRLLIAVSEPVKTATGVLQVSASIGATFYPQARPMDTEHILSEADFAMYQAKTSGKNRYVIARMK